MKFDKRPRFKQKRASELIVNATAASAAPFKPGLASDGPSPSESRAHPVPEQAAAVSEGPAGRGHSLQSRAAP